MDPQDSTALQDNMAALSADDVEAAVNDILMTLEIPAFHPDGAASGEAPVSAAVILHGSTSISLVVEAQRHMAGSLAAAFFGLDNPATANDADLADAMGELANIFGGSIKPLLAGTWVISIPDRAAPRIPTSAGTIRVEVFAGSGTVTVALAPHEPGHIEPGAD